MGVGYGLWVVADTFPHLPIWDPQKAMAFKNLKGYGLPEVSILD